MKWLKKRRIQSYIRRVFMSDWKVVVNINGNRQFVDFEDYESAEKYKERVTNELNKQIKKLKVGVVSRYTPYFPDEKLEKPKGKNYLWCPYCIAYRYFRQQEGYTACDYCGISNKDFYVRKCNSS